MFCHQTATSSDGMACILKHKRMHMRSPGRLASGPQYDNEFASIFHFLSDITPEQQIDAIVVATSYAVPDIATLGC
ncbi:hypothetical protein SAMD00023353_2400060 [Rosellinia necatrix]|uniref:Uncharacterized protein n=1 Tax=Rosellinia necatrix TaxID=77044 RepID=A0A1S8A852_ROSNE|nr:hypothetical protein SAMD00023353_2400060 [Rosellinia necatrix]